MVETRKKYRMKNLARHPRVIYDGFDPPKPIHFEVGQEREVEVSDKIAAELRDREEKGFKDVAILGGPKAKVAQAA